MKLAPARPNDRGGMNTLSTLYDSTIGKKYVMAVTGMGLFLFVIAHMLGNLQLFLGANAVNAYAIFLKSKPVLLWGLRLGLLLLVVLHITAAVQLTLRNRAARPETYANSKAYKATYCFANSTSERIADPGIHHLSPHAFHRRSG